MNVLYKISRGVPIYELIMFSFQGDFKTVTLKILSIIAFC